MRVKLTQQDKQILLALYRSEYFEIEEIVWVKDHLERRFSYQDVWDKTCEGGKLAMLRACDVRDAHALFWNNEEHSLKTDVLLAQYPTIEPLLRTLLKRYVGEHEHGGSIHV